MNWRISSALALGLALAPLAGTVEAQAYGRLVLTLEDEQGAPVADARVTVTCSELPAFTLEAKSNKKGRVTLPFADATRTYTLRIEADGFAPVDSNFKPEIRKSLQRNVVLQELGAGVAAGGGVGGELVLSAADRTFNEGVEALRADDLDTGKAKFLEVLKNNPSYAAAHSALAGVYLAQGDAAAALASAKTLFELEPKNPRAFRLLYEANRALGHEAEAAEALEAMKQLDRSGDIATLIYNEGVDAVAVGDLSAAKRRFQEALEMQPGLAPALQALAILHIDEQAWSEAAPLAEQLLAADPDNLKAKRMLYDAYSALGDEAKAKEALTRLAAADPATLSRQFYQHGVQLFNNNKLAEAAAQFETAAEVDPSFGKVHYHLGLCYVNLGDKPRAREHLAKFLEMTPEDPDAEAARGMLDYLDG
jgi:tetratricopeptide (TPR) repeat protein